METVPVVTLSCPTCGGAVKGADLGERVACSYCNTDLHLPDLVVVEEAPRVEGETPSAPRPVALQPDEDEVVEDTPRSPSWVGSNINLVLLLAVTAALAIGVYVWRAWKALDATAPGSTPSGDPCAQTCISRCGGQVEGLARDNCETRCHETCKGAH